MNQRLRIIKSGIRNLESDSFASSDSTGIRSDDDSHSAPRMLWFEIPASERHAVDDAPRGSRPVRYPMIRLHPASPWFAASFTAILALPSVVLAQGEKSEAAPTTKPQAKTKTPAKKAAARPTRPPVPPTHADVAYGDHARQVSGLLPGGVGDPHTAGCVHPRRRLGQRRQVGNRRDQHRSAGKAGISVAAINYRFVTQAQDAGIKPPVKWPLEDAAHAVQFLRSRASGWNIDKTRIGATGGSAGACSSLWLAFHDDMTTRPARTPSPANRPV